MTTPLVLVHGGSHGAWCWAPTLACLAGPALAVDLPPVEARGGPRRLQWSEALATITVADWADAVIAALDAAGIGRAVLVGHSLGGLTIAEVARTAPSRVAALAFVSAAVPKEGESVADSLPDELADLTRRAAVELLATGRDELGLTALPPELQLEMFGNDMDDAQRAFLLANTGAEAVRPLIEAVTRSGIPPELPKTYIRLLRDRSLEPARQDLMIRNLEASPGGVVDVVEIDSGHDVMITAPEQLARVLTALAS